MILRRFDTFYKLSKRFKVKICHNIWFDGWHWMAGVYFPRLKPDSNRTWKYQKWSIWDQFGLRSWKSPIEWSIEPWKLWNGVNEHKNQETINHNWFERITGPAYPIVINYCTDMDIEGLTMYKKVSKNGFKSKGLRATVEQYFKSLINFYCHWSQTEYKFYLLFP